MISNDLLDLILALVATWIMARIERRRFADYGIPVGNAFGRDYWVGLAWGLGSTSLLIGLIAAFGGYRILGLAIHGGALWHFLVLWIIANLLIGFAEEIQFRGYLLATLADGIGFWAAAILLSIGFGALHYFLKPHERWEDFASTGLLGLFMCLTLRRTGSLAFAIGFHAAFDFANLFLWSGQNAGEYAVGHLLETRWQGPQWLTGGFLGPGGELDGICDDRVDVCCVQSTLSAQEISPLRFPEAGTRLIVGESSATLPQSGCFPLDPHPLIPPNPKERDPGQQGFNCLVRSAEADP